MSADGVTEDATRVTVRGDWLVRAERADVYALISDFARMPEHFPKVAREIRIVKHEGNVLQIEAEAASFGRLFPPVRIEMTAYLLPGVGYRCTTRNLTFNTTGDEQLLLAVDPRGTRIHYTYYVTVRNVRMRPLYAWLTRTFGLPYWRRAVVDRLQELLDEAASPVNRDA